MTGSPKHPSGCAPRGTSLVELLVAVSVLSLLASLLFPAVLRSRAASQSIQCANNLRQLSLAAMAFHTVRSEFPPGLEQSEWSTPPRFRGTSLFSFLLPHIEENGVASDWDFDTPSANTSGGIHSRSARSITMFVCPSDRLELNPVRIGDAYFGMTSYGGNGGTRSVDPSFATADGIFHITGPAAEPTRGQRPTRMSDITDGTTNTVLFGERRHDDPAFDSFADANWIEPLRFLGRWGAIGGRRRIADVTLSAFGGLNYQLPFNYEDRSTADPPLTSSRKFADYEDRRVSAFGSEHRGGAYFAFVDGSVRFVSEKIASATLVAMCTRANQEIHHESDDF